MRFGLVSTQDSNLAAVLAAFGVPFYKADPIRRVRQNGKDVCIFNFEPTKEAQEIARNWQSEKFIAENPEAPLAYVSAFVHNKNRLIDLVKQCPAVEIVQRNGKIFFVPLKPTTATGDSYE